MRVEVRLFATLRQYLLAGGDRGSARLEISAGSSVADVVSKLGIPDPLVHLVLVDGRYEPNRGRLLEDGVVLSIWPPIAGG